MFPKAKKRLGHIAALNPGCHGGDAVPHLPEHALPVHTVEGVGEVKEEGPADGCWYPPARVPQHVRWLHNRPGLQHRPVKGSEHRRPQPALPEKYIWRSGGAESPPRQWGEAHHLFSCRRRGRLHRGEALFQVELCRHIGG